MEAPPHPQRLGDVEQDYYVARSQDPLQEGEPQSTANPAARPITGTAREVGGLHP
jgi:NADH-quinone oxidoreductase subunit I